MKWEVKMYVGGTVFTESVHAVNREDAVDTAKNRNPHARIIGVNPKPVSYTHLTLPTIREV